MKKVSSNKAYHVRMLVTFLATEALFAICIMRAFQLQVVDSAHLKALAERQHHGIIVLSPDRGTIFDRNGNQLAISTMTSSLYAHPTKVASKRQVALRIAKLLTPKGSSPHRLQHYLYRKLRRKVPFVWLARQQDPQKIKKILSLKIKGIGAFPEPKRFYPRIYLAAQCLGFCNIDGVGQDGIELTYDKYLRGKPVRILVKRDAKGNLIITKKQEAFATSVTHNITLTLDETIQHITEEELAKAVILHGAKNGMAIVMNPITGEILAMADYPFYNPNRRPTDVESLNIRRNRAVTDPFEPGSMIKPFLVAAAIASGHYRGIEKINCENGHLRIGHYTIHDVHPHHILTLADVIKFSSNIGAAKIGLNLGGKILYRMYRRFGFGQKTGIGLPGESPGIMQPLKCLPTIALANISFGQGIAVTALQLVTAVSAIANGGDLMRPYIVEKIVDDQGVPILIHRPMCVRRVLTPQTAHLITTFMEGVTQPGGTGTQAAIKGVTVAGKTGTSQKPQTDGEKGYAHNKFIGSFVGFVPAEDPKLAILVVINEPKGIPYGGVVAAPAFRAIASRSLQYLNILPHVGKLPLVAGRRPLSSSTQKFSPKNLEKTSSVKAETHPATVSLPDFSGMSMRQVIRWGARYGINLTLKGSGRACRQSPKAGTPILPGGRCSVWFTFPS